MKFTYLFSLIIAFGTINFNASAQTKKVGGLVLIGHIFDETTGAVLPDSWIEIDTKDKLTEPVFTKDGSYKFELSYGQEYTVRIGAAGHVTKFVVIDAINVPESEQTEFAFDMDMKLPQAIAGVDYKLFEKPVGIARYNATSKELEFDAAYSKNVTLEYKQLMKSAGKK